MYEHLVEPNTGSAELTRIVRVLKGKSGMDCSVGPNAVSCVWDQTWKQSKLPFNNNRDKGG
eukprot:15364713-Ditylum_brightwellii.AAC.2